MKIELEKCCGREPLITEEEDFLGEEPTVWVFQCPICKHKDLGFTHTQAMQHWNQRAKERTPPK